MKTAPRHRAFTLLEIMVALALLSVIVIAIYSSWRAILKGTAVAREVASAAQRTRITMRTLEDSLLCACMFNSNPDYYNFQVDGDGAFSSFSFVARLPRSFPRSGKFGDLDVRRLSFGVETGADSVKQLVLRQNPILMDMDKDEMENPLVLARNVQTFVVEYIDPKTGEWVSEWANSNMIPREVRIQLAISHADKNITEPLEVMIGTVAMPGQLVRTEWQLPMNAATGLGPVNTGGATGGTGANSTGQGSGQAPVTKQ